MYSPIKGLYPPNLFSETFKNAFTIDGNFETFYTGTPIISQRVAQEGPVNASEPGNLALLLAAGAGALAFRRREKPQVNSKYN